uniref:Leishmanolysin-like peptidase n=1 Tax=Trichobilharzia regenti TaxID=157069 RepID=A0AA85KPK2_TRIRE|nr:unnamed protein product [Trichobilharzia regenti]
MRIFIFFTVGLLLLTSVDSKYTCKVVEDAKTDDGLHSTTPPERPFNDKHLKFILIYDKKVQNSVAYEKLKHVVKSASDFWSQTLTVKFEKWENLLVKRECVSGSLQLSRREKLPVCRRTDCKEVKLCYNYPVPSNFLAACYYRKYARNTLIYPEGSGVKPNELVLFVTNVFINPCGGGTIAWATHCERDPQNKRPFMGRVNFCYDANTIKTMNDIYLIDVTKHEIAHILGISPSIFASLPDLEPAFRINNNPRPVQNVTREWVTPKRRIIKNKLAIRLPKMLEEARKHFGCDELDGIEIYSDHFSHRILGNDLMTAHKMAATLLSRITLAYLEDTNMYTVNYSMADDFKWGKNLGCDFVMKTCYEFIKNRKLKRQDIQPFCDDPDKRRCVNFDKARGHCNVFNHQTPIPDEYQYMDENFKVPAESRSRYGGWDAMEYCPFVDVTGTRSGLPSVCRDPFPTELNISSNNFLEEMGPDSACFNYNKWIHETPRAKYQFTGETACHRYQCSRKVGLQIIINNTPFVCPLYGGLKNIEVTVGRDTITATVNCPRCPDICKNECP